MTCQCRRCWEIWIAIPRERHRQSMSMLLVAGIIKTQRFRKSKQSTARESFNLFQIFRPKGQDPVSTNLQTPHSLYTTIAAGRERKGTAKSPRLERQPLWGISGIKATWRGLRKSESVKILHASNLLGTFLCLRKP